MAFKFITIDYFKVLNVNVIQSNSCTFVILIKLVTVNHKSIPSVLKPFDLYQT